MIPSMRFYIVSIVSIFVALGIGIYIGFVIDGNTIIDEKQEDLISIVEGQINEALSENNRLKNENIDLEKEIENNKIYMKETYTYLLENRLEGKNILLVELNDYYPVDIGKTLEFAGGKITSSLNMSTSKSLDINEFKALIDGIVQGRELLVEELAKDYDLVANPTSPVNAIILLGGYNRPLDENKGKIDIEIAKLLKEYDLDLLYIEKENVNYSNISEMINLGLSTVNNVDDITGKISSVYLLSGESGNYGNENSKDGIMPALNRNTLGENNE